MQGQNGTVDEGLEDTYLTSKSRESELEVAQCKPRVKKVNWHLVKKRRKMKDKATSLLH